MINGTNPIFTVIEMGSGKTKCLTAQVDLNEKKMTKVIYSQFKKLRFAEAYMNHPKQILDEEIYQQAVTRIKKYSKRSKKNKAVKIIAVATEAFRKAKNGKEFLQKLSNETNVSVRMISQEEEAINGFETAVLASGHPRDSIISWDCGSGSLQITTLINGEYVNYSIPYGTTPATHLLLKLKGLETKRENTPNPVSEEEVKAFVSFMQEELPKPNAEILNKLKNSKNMVVGIGNRSSTLGVCSQVTKKEIFTRQELWDGIQSLLGRNSKYLSNISDDISPRTVLPRLLLTYSVMLKLNIEQIEWKDTNGTCLGILAGLL